MSRYYLLDIVNGITGYDFLYITMLVTHASNYMQITLKNCNSKSSRINKSVNVSIPFCPNDQSRHPSHHHHHHHSSSDDLCTHILHKVTYHTTLDVSTAHSLICSYKETIQKQQTCSTTIEARQYLIYQRNQSSIMPLSASSVCLLSSNLLYLPYLLILFIYYKQLNLPYVNTDLSNLYLLVPFTFSKETILSVQQ